MAKKGDGWMGAFSDIEIVWYGKHLCQISQFWDQMNNLAIVGTQEPPLEFISYSD